MRMFRTVLAFTLVLGTVAAGSAAAPTGNERATYIVVFDDSVSDVEAEARQLVNANQGQLGFVYQHALKGFSAELTSQAASALARNPRVVAVNEDRPVHMAAEEVPTGVSRIDAPTAHESSATGAGIRVAIIDTGIDLDHPDLEANIDKNSGIDCINNDAIADDDQGHGTHVAGTVAAVGGNDLGVVGVAPGATLIPVKVLDSSGSGSWASVICGVDHAAGPGNADVANLSLGGSGSADGPCDSTTEDTLHLSICAAVDAGVTVVVAAGNDATNASNFIPAAYPEVITVSAYTDFDGTTADSGCTGGRGPFRTCDETFASFSNYGDIVDVIAPGVTINSTTVGGSYGTKSGTSMASPHVAGVVALVLQADSTLTPAQVEAHLRSTGQCPDGNENGGSEDCTGQDAWTNDRDTTTEPMVNAAFATGSVPGDGGDTNTPPTASFTFSCTDLTCDFDASDSSDDGTIASYSWDFGDTNTGSGVTTSHTYGAGGNYTVTLTVTDDDGVADTDSQVVSVSDPGSGDPDPGDDVTLTGSSENNGSSWTATVTLTGPEGTTTTGSWDVGGGETTCTIGTGQTSCTVTRTGIHKRVSSVTYTDNTTSNLGAVTISKP